jgi:hypothetical protein
VIRKYHWVLTRWAFAVPGQQTIVYFYNLLGYKKSLLLIIYDIYAAIQLD